MNSSPFSLLKCLFKWSVGKRCGSLGYLGKISAPCPSNCLSTWAGVPGDGNASTSPLKCQHRSYSKVDGNHLVSRVHSSLGPCYKENHPGGRGAPGCPARTLGQAKAQAGEGKARVQTSSLSIKLSDHVIKAGRFLSFFFLKEILFFFFFFF